MPRLQPRPSRLRRLSGRIRGRSTELDGTALCEIDDTALARAIGYMIAFDECGKPHRAWHDGANSMAARHLVQLRWSSTVGQFDGLVKLGPGCCQAANLIMLPTP
jgi:hypothetical protein